MKKVINGKLNLALDPIKYKYAWQFYQNAKKNFWTPEVVQISDDIYSFKHMLSETEKHVFMHVFAQLSTQDAQVTSILNDIGSKFTSTEHSMAIAMQQSQEAVHVESYKYCADHIGIDSSWLWSRWKHVPSIKAKIDYCNEIFNDSSDFIYQYLFLAGIFEGVFFMGGFSPIFALARNNKVMRVSEILQYIAIDEQSHVNFGLQNCKDIIRENNLNFDQVEYGLVKMMTHSLKLELDYINFIFSEGGYLGYTVTAHMRHVTWLASQVFHKLGMNFDLVETEFDPVKLMWIDEMLITNKEKNFFETRVTEYQKTELSYVESKSYENMSEIEKTWDNLLVFKTGD